MSSRFNRHHLSLLATTLVAIALWTGASLRFPGFASLGVFVNLFDDNAFLGIAAVGMTFVVLSGGIDLSVGAMIGVTSIAAALLIERAQFHPGAVGPMLIVAGAMFGAGQGALIAVFELAPFLVTLAGMFLLRGLAFTLSLESIPLTHPALTALTSLRIPLGTSALPPLAILFLAVVVVGSLMANGSRFGRSVYALGGNAHSARLMGLPIFRTQILVYALSGALGALAGLTFTLYTFSGNATAATGLELDAIAAVVVGGTLLSGGRGSVFGTLVGVSILGMIQTIITFESTLSSWWTKIVIGALLFVFVALQRALVSMGAGGPGISFARLARLTRFRQGMKSAVLALAFVAPLAAAGAPSRSPHALPLTGSVTKDCPGNQQSGRQIEDGLIQLTGTSLKVGQTVHPVPELPDPAPPYITQRGEVEIYGSAQYFIRYRNWREFSEGGCYQIVPLRLVNPNGARYSGAYSHPWDLRKTRIVNDKGGHTEILIGGAMSASRGRPSPRWPEDNFNRRIFFFRRGEVSRWIRDLAPIIGDVDSGWIGHSYGGNLIQENQTRPNVIQPGALGEIGFFYERVSEVRGGGPFKTEIFAVKMSGLDRGGHRKEIKILGIGSKPFPSTARTLGGYLVEGPRPTLVTIGGKKVYIIGFSSGDFPTDAYSINYMWSRDLFGPYLPALTADGRDLLDLGKDLKERYGLSWVGRPSLYRTPGGYEMFFHGVMKNILPDNDYKHWPSRYQLWEFYRSLFKVRVKFSLGPDGAPVIDLDIPSYHPFRARGTRR